MPKILIIDDDPAFRRILAAVLEKGGFHQCLHAGSGAEGLTQAGATAPDMIVLDLRLKDTNGFEVLYKLRTDQATTAIPVVIITGESHSTDLLSAAATSLGATAFYQKRSSLDTLLKAIQDVVGAPPGKPAA